MTPEENVQFNELSKLEKDSNFLNIHDMLDGDNAVEFFGMDSWEIKHSYALYNLFNVTDYVWGSAFVESFLKKSKIGLPKDFDYSSLKVKREYGFPPNEIFKDSGSLDILLYSTVAGKETVILIENKVFAKESNKQLEKYEYGVEYDSKFKGYKCYYIFLTNDGRKAKTSPGNKWVSVSYKTVIEMLNEIVPKVQDKLSSEMQSILNQYKQFIRRKIIMDDELIKKCESLVKKYPNAVNAVIQYKESLLYQVNKEIAEEISAVLDNLEKKGVIYDLIKPDIEKSVSCSFTFKSTNLKDKINGDTKSGMAENPVIYTITRETAIEDKDVQVQCFVCYGYYYKRQMKDVAIEKRILQIFTDNDKTEETDVSKPIRILPQLKKKDAILFDEVYDKDKIKSKDKIHIYNKGYIKEQIDKFLNRAKEFEDKY